jgi:hypothetical protein
MAMKRGTKVGILKSSRGIHWKTAQPVLKATPNIIGQSYMSMLVLNDMYVSYEAYQLRK